MNSEERAEQTRRVILLAACDTIAEVGFEKVRMRMVAERAGVSSGLLHYHFATREKLFLEALAFSYEHAGVEGYGARPPEAQPNTWRLGRVIDACLPIDAELRRDFLLWQELHLRAVRDADSLTVARDLYANLRDWIAGVVRDGQATGEFTACDVGRLADLVIALTNGFGTRILLGSSALDVADARDQIWSLIAPQLGITTPFPAAAAAVAAKSTTVSAG
ncbi:TetR/AcrR family transcriptional regulator [Streptacidiphilus fuscans]|uniref:TetR/AcrR family transcriptional regulator n=1 Tax=Streptacidiphilus fuscans TaxID=2789292 RepID=A0A931FEN4_9ACTN|nr:TetR/AcrR family transcriptional regulator [Streptacidiphilus fuscans]MBF9069410.1 TetR/AcrR family transcriptional regulator [Streptacidiphilus fuscans]